MFQNTKIKLSEWIIILLYFFVNSLFLPNGLLYTTILTPLFIVYLYNRKVYQYIFIFLLLISPFIVAHLSQGVDMYYYLRSTLLVFSTVVFSVFTWHWAKDFQGWDIVMGKLVYISAALSIIALIFFNSPNYVEIWWWVRNLTPGVKNFPRLKLLTYEASYFSMLMVPVTMYLVYSSLLHKNFKKNLIYLLLLLVMFVMSLSFGVIGGIIIAISPVLFVVLYNRYGWKKPLLFILIGLILVTGCLYILYEYYPKSAIVTRLNNIATGNDSSFRGRTTESFELAKQLLKMKSELWGVGPGQIKVLGGEIWSKKYQGEYNITNVAIPNSAAETLAIFGYIGLFLRITVQLFLFFATQVHKNAFKLSLFLFIFIYQFTGSFIVNIAEYVIWILAFVPNFQQFDFRNYKLTYENSISFKS